MSKGKLLVLSGPSGVGKGTVVNELLKRRPKAALSVSCTTRAPREGERDGISYFFITKDEFRDKISKNGFLEYSEHFGNFYGTPRAFVEEKLKGGDVILEIEVDGALQVKKSHPEAVLVMLLPPNMDELKRRLSGRGTEDKEKIAARLARVEYELGKKELYDYIVINDDLEEAVTEIESILEKE